MNHLVLTETGKFKLAALLKNNELYDLLIEPLLDRKPSTGDIYRGILKNWNAALHAHHVDLGDHMGILECKEPRQAGSVVTVQVTRPAQSHKDAKLTERVELIGNSLVMKPHQAGVFGASKHITPDEVIKALSPYTETTSLILRSHAAKEDIQNLTTEAARLTQLRAMIDNINPPSLAFLTDVHQKALREWHWQQVMTSTGAFNAAQKWIKAFAPYKSDSIYQSRLDPFEDQDLYGTINDLYETSVHLPSGGTMMIEQTHALIAVDIDTGHSDPAKADYEAANLVCRQMRLRGLAGQICIDFCSGAQNRDTIMKAIHDNLDRNTKIAGWGPLGMLELTRKRDRQPITAFERINE